MSRLPRGSVAGTTAATVSGGIRPPSSGMTLPRSLANRDFMNELSALPALPALTQRMHSGVRRATLTNATFTPPPTHAQALAPALTPAPVPADASATIGRSSAISARSMFGGSVSPSPGAVPTDSAASLVMRSPASTASKEAARLATLSRSLTRSPTRGDLGDGHELPESGPISRGGISALRPSEGPVPNAPTSGSSALHQRNASAASKQASGNAAHLRCGEPVFIPVQGLRGTLRYLGPIDGKQGTWAGVELDEVGKGKNDGTVAGKSYFACLPNTGLFLVPSKVEPLSRQKHNSSDSAGEQIPSISSVLSSAPTEVSSAHSGKQPGPAKRSARSTTTSVAPQRTQAKSPGRSRISSDANLQTTLPNVAGSVSNNSSSSGLSSPANNRRRTQSRIAPIPSATGLASEVSVPSRSRPPPATVSRGTGRPRPLSTAGSIASNRTSSPPLSRPSSRSLAPPTADQPQSAAAGTPRQLPHSRSAATASDAQPPASAPAMRRRLVANGAARSLDTPGKASGTGPRAKASNSADPTDRLRLRIDMLEAENRVLRLKNEQDKAHLAASQMLARDLVGTNAPISPQIRSTIDGIGRLSLRSPMAASMAASMATSLAASAAADGMANSSLDAMQKQLLEATEQLERERKQSQSQIAALQSQISELSADAAQTRESQAGSQSEGDGNSQRVEPAATGDGELARRGKEVAELEARLAKAEQEHAQELAAAQDAQKETLLALEQRLAETESLQSHLDLKASELSSLNARLDKSAADLARMTRMYEELVAEREQEQEQQQQRREDGLSEESEMVASLKKQMEKLRRDFVDAEEQRQVLFNRLEAATVARSEAESRLSTVVPDLEQLRLKTGDYEEKCAVLSQCRECLGEIVALARKKSSDSDVDADSARRASAEPTGPLDPLELLSLSKHLVLQLVERVAALGQHSAEMSNDIEAKGTRISELERELEEARRLSERDAAQGEHAEKQSDSAGGALGNVQSRIEELERVNSELIEERNQFIQDQVVFNDYLEKLESESNRLVEDIEQLTVENQRLTEELRMASLHNSTVSLDVAAIDSKLAGELAEAERDEQPAQTKPSSEGGGNAATKTEAEVDADALQHKHQREIGLMQIRISELEQRKNTEIKRLQDEIGTLEDLVEDKIFSESELNDKVASLSSEVDRLQREIKHLRGSETSSGKTYTSAENGIDTLLKPTNAFAVNGSPLDCLTTDAGIAEESASSLSATNLVISGKHDGIDNDDDESVYCDICDVSTHRISDCPEISATSNIFKQEVPIDSSRPYCDNCELFDHWTDECPHGDEMF